MEPNKPTFVRPAFAMRRLGIGRTKFYELIKRGRMRLVKLDGASLVPLADIEDFEAKLLANTSNLGA